MYIPRSFSKKQADKKKSEATKNELTIQEEKSEEQKKIEIYQKAKLYEEEYELQKKELLALEQKALKEGNFYVKPEPKVAFLVRIRGINSIDPKSRTILKLLRLPQIHNGVFFKINKATLNMIKRVEPYLAYGYPDLTNIRKLIYKRGYAKVNGSRIQIQDNQIIETHLGQYGIVCIEDLVHEIATCGPHFKEANNFLWPFKLNSPIGGYVKKRNHFQEGGDYGNREEFINDFICRMN